MDSFRTITLTDKQYNNLVDALCLAYNQVQDFLYNNEKPEDAYALESQSNDIKELLELL